MNNMLSTRLKSLVKYVDINDNIIDIGCDHALLDIYLISNNVVNNVIVSDVSQNALNQGIENIKKYNLEDKIEARCGNGLEVLNIRDSINTLIISGMGSNTILNILNNKYLNNINKLIIQSNNDYELLRIEIVKLGFKIDKEEVVIDKNKLYINIVFIRGIKNYSLEEYKYGLNTMVNKDVYYKYLINKYNKIIKNLDVSDKKNILLEEIRYLKDLL